MSKKTRKLIWSAPLVAVLAVAGALALFVALTPNSAQAHDLPGPVSDLTAEGTSWSTIKLIWKAPTTGGVTGYRIDVSEDEFIWEALVMDTGNTRTTYTHSGLDGGVTRNYRVFALNAAGAGPSPVGDDASNDLFVAGTTLPAEAPGQVLNLRATGVSHSQIDVMWSASRSTGGADIDRYCFIVGATRAHVVGVVDAADSAFDAACMGDATVTPAEDVDQDDANTDPGNLVGISNLLNVAVPAEGYLIVIDANKPAGHEGRWPMFEHKGLNSELKLYYRLYAVNSEGPSATATNIVSATTKTTPKPGVPRGLKLVSTGPGGQDVINLYWNWPANALKTPANGFYFQVRSSSVGTWSDPAPATGATRSNFPVQATHDPNETELMDIVLASGDGVIPVVRARKAATYLQYRVMVGEKGTPSRPATIKLVPPADGATVPTLPTLAELPGKTEPDNVSDDSEPTDLSFESTLRTVKLTWEREGDPAVDPDPAENLPSGFVIDAVMGQSTDTDLPVGFQPLQPNTTYTGKVSGTDTTSIYTHKGAMPNQEWNYRVFPYTSGKQWFGKPLILDANTKPAEPPEQFTCAQVSSDDDGPTRITVTWPAPGKDGGSAIAGFLVQVGADTDDDGSNDSADETWEMAPLGVLDADARSYTYAPKGGDTLSSGSIRWLRVIVLNGVNTDANGALLGAADLSSVCAIKGETAASGTPGQPDGLVTEPARDAGSLDPDNPVPNSERGVLLLWNAPDDPAGDTVTDYVVARRVRDDSSSAWGDWDEDWAEIDESATSYTDTVVVAELDNGEARQYRVAAQSGSGTGAWTPVITYPHSAATHVPPTTALAKPTAVVASSDATGELTLMWEGAANADLYVLIAVDLDPISWETEVITDGAARLGKVTGLTSGKRYLGIVVATRGTGTDTEVLYETANIVTVE